MNDCIFCKIINKKIPSNVVYENEHVLAFMDINPQASTHILVIPKQHVSSLVDTNVSEKMLKHILDAINNIVKQENLITSGFRVVTNSGADAGQTVLHLHFHILGGKRLSDKMA